MNAVVDCRAVHGFDGVFENMPSKFETTNSQLFFSLLYGINFFRLVYYIYPGVYNIYPGMTHGHHTPLSLFDPKLDNTIEKVQLESHLNSNHLKYRASLKSHLKF